jgi:hypothetical protein
MCQGHVPSLIGNTSSLDHQVNSYGSILLASLAYFVYRPEAASLGDLVRTADATSSARRTTPRSILGLWRVGAFQGLC